MKTTIKNVIVAVDFSDYSKLVVDEAKALSKKLKANLSYIYAIQDVSMFTSTYKLNKAAFLRETEQMMRETYNLDGRSKVFIKVGKPHERIIRLAKKLRDPLIVIGHRGRNPIARLFLGSTAEKVALYSPCPVWIQRGESLIIPKRILVPFDFSNRTERSIRSIHTFNKNLKATVEMFHVMEVPIPAYELDSFADIYAEKKRIDEEGVAAFKKKYPKIKMTHTQGWVVENIKEKSKDFDLIALAPRNSQNLGYFGSVTTNIIRTGNKSILIMP